MGAIFACTSLITEPRSLSSNSASLISIQLDYLPPVKNVGRSALAV